MTDYIIKKYIFPDRDDLPEFKIDDYFKTLDLIVEQYYEEIIRVICRIYNLLAYGNACNLYSVKVLVISY